MSKYVKCIKIESGEATGNFQVGQAGRDRLNNLYRFKGKSKSGVNVWLHVANFQHDTESFKWRYGSIGFKNDLKRMRAALKDKKPASSFSGKYGFKKDVRQKFYITYDRRV